VIDGAAASAEPVRGHRGLWLLAAVLLTVVMLGSGFVVMHGVPWGSSSNGGDVPVDHATLRPGQIVLTLKSHSDEIVAIAQAIVNDAYVNFSVLEPPAAAQLAIDYPWIEGESYEIELLTSTGASVDFEIEDAGAA
jgi:ZIP family zinc transporter